MPISPEYLGARTRVIAGRVRLVAITAFVLGILLAIGYLWVLLGDRGREYFPAYLRVTYGAATGSRRPVTIVFEGVSRTGSPTKWRDYLESEVYEGRSLRDLWRHFYYAAFVGTLAALGACAYVLRSRTRKPTVTERGSELLTAEELRAAIRDDGEPLGISVAGIPISRMQETQHILLTGGPGQGKSVTIENILCDLEERYPNHSVPVVIYDHEREFTERHFNPETDVILNPLDERSPVWCPWDEIRAEGDTRKLACSTIQKPPNVAANERFFIDGGRLVLTELFERAKTLEDFLAVLTASDDNFKQFFRGTAAEQVLGSKADNQLAGVRGTLSIWASAFATLKPVPETGPRWSASDWMASPRGWIFLTSAHGTRETTLPLLRLWIDLLASRLLERPGVTPPGEPEPLYFFLDELPTIGYLESIGDLAKLARKRGGRVILGVQVVSDLEAIFGKFWHSVAGLTATKVFFNPGEPNSGEWAVKSIGNRERRVVRESINTGNRDGQNFTEELRLDDLVLPSQLQKLKKFEAYIRCGTRVAKVRVPLPPPPPRQEPDFIPRKRVDRHGPESDERNSLPEEPAAPTSFGALSAAMRAEARAEPSRAERTDIREEPPSTAKHKQQQITGYIDTDVVDP